MPKEGVAFKKDLKELMLTGDHRSSEYEIFAGSRDLNSVGTRWMELLPSVLSLKSVTREARLIENVARERNKWMNGSGFFNPCILRSREWKGVWSHLSDQNKFITIQNWYVCENWFTFWWETRREQVSARVHPFWGQSAQTTTHNETAVVRIGLQPD